MPFELIAVSKFRITKKAMKKMIFAVIFTMLITGGVVIRPQELQQDPPLVQKKENADHRNGAPDMRHKKPVPLPLPPVKAPDTTKQVVANPKK